MSSPALPSALRRAALVTVLALATSALPARPTFDGSTPPAYPDAQHVLNGCFISTTAYLARFGADFPTERAAALTIAPRGFPGKHTIAVVTWNGRWWGRDEYFGVFALDCAVANTAEPCNLTARATKVFSRHASVEVRAGRVTGAPVLGGPLSVGARSQLISLGARLLPCPTETLWARVGAKELPFLFFRPAAGQVAIYDPASGTCRAADAGEDAAQLVREAATQLGYVVREVRRDFAPPSGAVVAATAAAPHPLVR